MASGRKAPGSKPGKSMKSRLSWSVEGVDPSVRERAEAAARHAGLSLGDWLNATVDKTLADFPKPPAPLPGQDARNVAEIHRQLAAVTNHIEQISRPAGGSAAPAIARKLNEAISRLDARLTEITDQTQPHLAETEPAPRQFDIARFAPANRKRLSAPALRTFLAIADLWELTEEQRLLMLGYPSRSTYHSWCKQAREHGVITLDVDVLTRISLVFGIHQALGILFASERAGVDWLRGPHQALVFGGRPPLELVTSGSQDGMLTVRRFLDGARGGLYMQPNAIDAAFTPYDDAEIVFR
jgi:hypothetical protein